jgi:hypothetical protein
MTLLDYPDESQFYKKSMFDLLDMRKLQGNPFDFRKKIEYVQRNAKNMNPAAWQKVVNFIADANKREIFFHKGVSEKKQYLVLSKAVNFPDRDISVELKLIPEQDAEICLAFNHAFNNSREINPPYSAELIFSDKIFCDFSRFSVPLCSGKTKGRTPGSSHKVRLYRVGGLFKLAINDKWILEYADPFPVTYIAGRVPIKSRTCRWTQGPRCSISRNWPGTRLP